jgi:hypothetical protein
MPAHSIIMDPPRSLVHGIERSRTAPACNNTDRVWNIRVGRSYAIFWRTFPSIELNLKLDDNKNKI